MNRSIKILLLPLYYVWGLSNLLNDLCRIFYVNVCCFCEVGRSLAEGKLKSMQRWRCQQ